MRELILKWLKLMGEFPIDYIADRLCELFESNGKQQFYATPLGGLGPRVLNKRTDSIPLDAIYVGRPSKWGNPFKMNDPLLPAGLSRDEKRQAVIDEYRRWIVKQPELMDSLSELRSRDLVCWCSPLPCHADILLELANKEGKV